VRWTRIRSCQSLRALSMFIGKPRWLGELPML
jgi:hypothetical protein